VIAATTLRALDLIEESDELRVRLVANARLFREGMTAAGFALAGAGHPIIPVMLGDAKLATEMAARLLSEGLYVTGFSFPVVPEGKARIRTQMSAAHATTDIEFARRLYPSARTRGDLVRALVKAPNPVCRWRTSQSLALRIARC
jgi:glycine C-acetyltransferase